MTILGSPCGKVMRPARLERASFWFVEHPPCRIRPVFARFHEWNHDWWTSRALSLTHMIAVVLQRTADACAQAEIEVVEITGDGAA